MNTTTGPLAVLGVGHLTAHLVPRLARGGAAPEILLSARNSETAARLRDELGLEIVADNAALIERASTVLLSVRPFQVADALKGLPWRADHLLISFCAGVSVDDMGAHASPAQIVRAMPVVAGLCGESATCLYPDDARAREVLAPLGPVTAVSTEEEFEAASVCGALYGWVQALIGEQARWLAERGVGPEPARALVTQTFRAAATFLRENPQTPIEDLVADLCKPESITGLGLDTLNRHEAFAGWRAAGDAVIEKLVPPDNR